MPREGPPWLPTVEPWGEGDGQRAEVRAALLAGAPDIPAGFNEGGRLVPGMSKKNKLVILNCSPARAAGSALD